MEYKFLGGSGLRVSRICLGTMTFGNPKDGKRLSTEAESHAILDRFVELGGNFIDTADVYNGGESEAFIGTWLAKMGEEYREKLVLATKTRFGVYPDDPHNGGGLSRKHIMRGVKDSLKRLQTSYLDLLQMHCWDDGTPIEETLAAVADLIRDGKVLYFGVSNVTGWQLQKIISTCEKLNIPRIVSIQAQYSLLCRWPEWELVDCCQQAQVSYMPWSPLKGGWLTGKMRRGMDAAPKDSRIAWAEDTGTKLQSAPGYSTFAKDDAVWDLIDLLATIADETGHSIAQVSLKWLLHQRTVDSVVIGARTMEQLEDNCQAGLADWSLSETQLQSLDDASRPNMPYPYEMISRCQNGRRH